MGMSASQTRYAMLTGKKSDVEFHGQQINQERTTLATQSSAYNTQLLNLSVPTPPSTSDFTTTSYTLNANGNVFTILGAQYQASDYYFDANQNVVVGQNPNANGTTYAGGTYVVTTSEQITAPQGKSSVASLFFGTTNQATGDVTYTVGQGPSQTTLSRVINNPGDPNYNSAEAIADRANAALIIQDQHLDPNTAFFKYESGGTTRYVTEAQLQQNASIDGNISTIAIPSYYVDPNASVTETSKFAGAKVDFSESGRMSSITDYSGDTYQLTVNTSSDADAYTDAMNEYTYQKALYDQEINNINAKMSIIQGEDKKLELKLKDLDTQNNAVQTEMDSVKKVIDKNIEQSFKAFA